MTIGDIFKNFEETYLLDSYHKEQIYKIIFDIHIKCYYSDNLVLGRKLGWYILNNCEDKDIRKIVLENQLIYADKLKDIEGAQIHTLMEPTFFIDNPKKEFKYSKYKTLNPSIFKDGDELYVNVRHVSFEGNYYNPMSKDNVIRTKNTLGKLTNGKINEFFEIKDCSKFERLKKNVIGFEDMKIFKKNNIWNFVATSYEASKTTCVVHGVLEDKPDSKYNWSTQKVTPLKGGIVSEDIPEKNWMPILNNKDDLELLYSTFPFVIVKFNDEENKVVKTFTKKWSKNLGSWRGSSCLLPFQNGYLYIIHEVFFSSNRRDYMHRFVWVDNSMNTLKYSNPFFFERMNRIEYCNGLALHEDKFYITYGDNDTNAKMIILDKNRVSDLLLNELN